MIVYDEERATPNTLVVLSWLSDGTLSNVITASGVWNCFKSASVVILMFGSLVCFDDDF